MKKSFGSLLVAMSLVSASASAGTINFGTLGLTDQQSVQGATFSGVTFTGEKNSLVYTAFYGKGLYDGDGASGDITMVFSTAITSLTLRGGDGGGDADAFGVSLYEFGTDSFLGYFTTPVFGQSQTPQWYTLTLSGLGAIGRAVFDPGNSGVLPGNPSNTGGLILTDVEFDEVGADVPEPASFALFGLGLIGAAGIRYRRKV